EPGRVDERRERPMSVEAAASTASEGTSTGTATAGSGRRAATGMGAAALAFWATLAWLTTETARIPPFQLMAMVFGVSFSIAAAKWVVRREPIGRRLSLAPAVWALGLFGLFGYHALYFVALRSAPAAEANLINYLWPLLLALLSALLPGERLRWWHLAGCLLGLSGASLLAVRGASLAFDAAQWRGYAAALGCAVIWPTYSVLSRRRGDLSTDVVGAFCGATALLAVALHLALEPWVAPGAREWMAILGMGVGPVGLALFAWDVGMKRGNVRALAAASYLEPILSTLVLYAAGQAVLSGTLAASCVLVAVGAVVGGWDALR
ncbi:MAG TPA: DMT family transporter, partial [Myxococcales bacterium]|nr:DMT family transporter [Myxococcales bacterium]